MATGHTLTPGDRKKQAAELVKNADKFLKSGDLVPAFQAVEQALQLDPGNLYAQAYKERIKAALAKAGMEEPAMPAPVQEAVPAPKPEPPPQAKAERPIEKQPPAKPEVKPAAKQETIHLKTEPAQAGPETTGKLRKLAAIMFTDMVGYTALAQTNESVALQLVDTQQKLLRPVFKKFDGKEIKTVGDAFLAEFVSVLQAVRCAMEIQKTMHAYNARESKERNILLRIGIHLGDIIYKDNDIYGDGVNIASRIQALANPGGIYVSQDVYNQIRNRDEFIIDYVGEVELKNIITPLPIYKVLSEFEVKQKEENEAIATAVKEGISEAQAEMITAFLAKAKQQLGKDALQEALIEVTKILQLAPQHPEARLIESQIRNRRIEIIGKQIEDTKKLPYKEIMEFYKETLKYALQEGELSSDEKRTLTSWREELQLTDNDHDIALKQLTKS